MKLYWSWTKVRTTIYYNQPEEQNKNNLSTGGKKTNISRQIPTLIPSMNPIYLPRLLPLNIQ